MPTIIATTTQKEPSKLLRIISSPSYMAVTHVGPPISGVASFPKLLSPSICYQLLASILSCPPITNSLAILTSIEPQWLHSEPSVPYLKRSSSVSVPGLTTANMDGTSDLPPSITVTITFMSIQPKQPKTLTLSLFFLPNSICQQP